MNITCNLAINSNLICVRRIIIIIITTDFHLFSNLTIFFFSILLSISRISLLFHGQFITKINNNNKKLRMYHLASNMSRSLKLFHFFDEPKSKATQGSMTVFYDCKCLSIHWSQTVWKKVRGQCFLHIMYANCYMLLQSPLVYRFRIRLDYNRP